MTSNTKIITCRIRFSALLVVGSASALVGFEDEDGCVTGISYITDLSEFCYLVYETCAS